MIILGMAMFVTGCTNSATTRQTFAEIISHTSNKTTPVWRDIEPGKTTETEFGKIVSRDPDVFENLTKGQLRPEGIGYIWYDTEFNLPSRLIFHENVASYLGFALPIYGFSGASFPFENILNIAGSPTAYFAGSITEEFIDIAFFYEETGVVINFYAKFDPLEMTSIRRNCEFDLTENTPVNNVTIYFVEQNDLDGMMTTLSSELVMRPTEIPEPWIGIEDALRLTSGRTYLEDKTLIDCSNR